MLGGYLYPKREDWCDVRRRRRALMKRASAPPPLAVKVMHGVCDTFATHYIDYIQ